MTVDLDSLKWWADVVHKFITSFGVIGLGIWHWILWLKDKEEAVKWVEHHIERRQHMSIIGDIQLAFKVEHEAVAALPVIAKAIADLKQAWFDKSDPTKATQDLVNALSDAEPLFNQILASLPAPTPIPVSPPPTTPA